MLSLSTKTKSQSLNSARLIRLYRLISILLVCFWQSNLFAQTTVTYCIDPDWLPYEAIKDGKHVGMSADYIAILEENTKYQYELVITKTWQQSKDFIKQGRCDLLPMLNQSEERKTYMDFSNAYFTSPNVLVSDKEQPFMQSLAGIGNRTLGVTHGYRTSEYVAEKYPTIKTVSFDTEQLGLLALARNEIDYFIGSVHSVNNQIQKLGLTNLKIAGLGGPQDELRAGVAKNKTQLLKDINLAITKITPQEHFEIYNRWNPIKVIEKTNYRLVWQILSVALIVFAMFLTRYFSIKKYNKRLKIKNIKLNELQQKLLKTNADLKVVNQKDSLTNLYNRHYFSQLISSNSYTVKEHQLCLIFIDLDHFKNINDVYGHLAGDEVLRSFADILRACSSQNELVCRWGGEEFVIIQQPGTSKSAESLCQNIQSSLLAYEFSHGEKVTASFGIAQLRKDENLLECFERADQMLYQAKKQGRNQIMTTSA